MKRRGSIWKWDIGWCPFQTTWGFPKWEILVRCIGRWWWWPPLEWSNQQKRRKTEIPHSAPNWSGEAAGKWQQCRPKIIESCTKSSVQLLSLIFFHLLDFELLSLIPIIMATPCWNRIDHWTVLNLILLFLVTANHLKTVDGIIQWNKC